jgi:DNA-binding IclR family transcriptional regulator
MNSKQQSREQAIGFLNVALASGKTLNEISAHTKIRKSTLYRWLNNTHQPHPAVVRLMEFYIQSQQQEEKIQELMKETRRLQAELSQVAQVNRNLEYALQKATVTSLKNHIG